MEPIISTSFIPKKPIDPTAQSERRAHRPFGLTSLLSVVLIVGTLGTYIGTYLYDSALTSEKTNLENQIAQAEQNIGSDFVAQMKTLDERITGVQALLASHVVTTPIFQALQQTTLRSVQYTSFDYELQSDPTTHAQTVVVTLLGTARTYATLALQSDAFSGNAIIKNPVFSDLTIDPVTHNVNFKLVFSVDKASLSYESFIDSLNLGTTASAVTTPSTSGVTQTAPVQSVAPAMGSAAPTGSQSAVAPPTAQ